MSRLSRIWMAVIVSVVMSLSGFAADDLSEPGGPGSRGVGGVLKKLGTFIDSMSVRGLDRNYIEMPEKPWQVIAKGKVNQSDLKIKSTLSGKMFSPDWGDIYWEPQIKTELSAYAGAWVGYRGYGIGFSKDLSGNGGQLKFGAVGGSYGVNLRIHRFQTDEPKVHLSGYMPDWDETSFNYFLIDPIRVRTLTLDGYYLFNGKRFSYAAAYDQSVIQKRSAGSLMAGAMYHHSSVAYDKGIDADFILFMNDIGRIKQSLLSVGAGYAYNYVPCRGLLVSAMAMPMLTVYNRIDIWRYHSNLREKAKEQQQNPTADDEIDLDWEDFEIWLAGKEKQHSRVTLTYNARLSVTYNLGNWFLNVFGQYNRFRFKHSDSSGRLHDWYINASVGVRM